MDIDVQMNIDIRYIYIYIYIYILLLCFYVIIVRRYIIYQIHVTQTTDDKHKKAESQI